MALLDVRRRVDVLGRRKGSSFVEVRGDGRHGRVGEVRSEDG